MAFLKGSNSFGAQTQIPKVFQLMMRDHEVLTCNNGNITVNDYERLPFAMQVGDVNFIVLFRWMSRRILPIQRENAKTLLNNLRLPQGDALTVAIKCKCLSLIDSYWVRTNYDETWDSVNLFHNKFSDAIATVAFTGMSDLSIQANMKTPELTGQGAYAKCWRREGNKIRLYKASTTVGYESESEVLASELLNHLGISAVLYKYSPNFKGRRVSICDNICDEYTSIVPFGDLEIHASAHGEDALEIIKSDYREDFYTMVLVDYIIGNTDRHSLNWGVLHDNYDNKILGLHPIFDLNNSFNFKDANAPSIIKERTSMKMFALEAMEELKDYELLDIAIKYLSSRGVRSKHRELLGTTYAADTMIARCEWLQ